MKNKILILILGCAVSALIALTFPALFFPAATPYAAPAVFFVLTLPLPLLLLAEFLPRGKAKRAARRLLEATVGVCLYLLIVLTGGALCCLLLRVTGARVDPALAGVCMASVFILAVVTGRLHARRLKTVKATLFYDRAYGGFQTLDQKKNSPVEKRDHSVRVLFFSDLHLGFFTSRRFLYRLSAAINSEKPDYIFFGGDLLDGDYEDLKNQEAMLSFFRQTVSAKGFYACPGNHDAYSKDDPRAGEFIKKTGVRMLEDETVVLPFCTLIGRKDENSPRKSADAFSYRDKPVVVLDHRPGDIGNLEKSGADLVLCGHTHNGQTFPGNIAQRILDRYSYGMKRAGKCLVYTTSGAGYWGFPLRLFTSNEIVVFDFLQKNE